MNNKAHLRPQDYDSNGDIIPMACKEEKGDLISREALKKAVEELKRPKAYSEADVRQNVVIDCVLHIINNAPIVEPRIEYGTDGQPYKLSMTNGKEYERPQGGQVVPDMLQGWRYEENEKGGAE